VSSDAPFVLINAFEVPEGSDKEFVAAWQAAREFLETRAGYLGTTLHQAVTPEAEFRFVNVARWRTAEDFQAAVTSDAFRAAAAGLAQFRSHPGLYRVVGT
jgi:heme oxygenase (mycobilin-producing)